MVYDVFISHATPDKEAVARPLSEALQARGLSVWLDEEQLQIGDSIRRGIDAGLQQSRFGVVILSPAYLQSEWTAKELDALFNRETQQAKTILPIAHQLDRDSINAFSPMLADKATLSTAEGIEVLADKIQHRVQALPTPSQAHTVKFGSAGFRFPNTNWQWLLVFLATLAAVAVPVLIPDSPPLPQNAVTVNGGMNGGSINNTVVEGDQIQQQTIINQNADAKILAQQLFEIGAETQKDLQSKDEEIKRLTETITRLQQAPGDEYKQEALQKLQEKKPGEAAELLKKSIAERSQARKELAQQEAQDWIDIGNISYLNSTQDAFSAYQKAIELDPSSAEAWSHLASILTRLGNYNAAIKSSHNAINLAKSQPFVKSESFRNLGSVHDIFNNPITHNPK